MRLIHTSKLQLVEFTGRHVPPYAILSHTWEDLEISYKDFQRFTATLGLPTDSKIGRCCSLAASEGWQYVWVDTCCIDKSSSAELTESINSMYKWYERAEVCYVYLTDISLKAANQDNKLAKSFGESRWFTRGWTLQELLAPERVVFYDCDWLEIGCKDTLRDAISNATNIQLDYLFDPAEASVAAKMSWVSSRETTRPEDTAYCLLGLFDVSMPLIYGEGNKAFTRLQYQIIQSSSDQSIFAWRCPKVSIKGLTNNLLATTPKYFEDSGDIVPLDSALWDRNSFSVRNRGLVVDLYIEKNRYLDGKDDISNHWVAPLACSRAADPAPIMLRFCENKRSKACDRSNARVIESLKDQKYLQGFQLSYDELGPKNWPFQLRTFFFPMGTTAGTEWVHKPIDCVDPIISFTAAAVGEFPTIMPGPPLFPEARSGWDQNGKLTFTSHFSYSSELRFGQRDGTGFVLSRPMDVETGDLCVILTSFAPRITKNRSIKLAETLEWNCIRYLGQPQSYTEKIGANKHLWIKIRPGMHENEIYPVIEIDVTDLDRSKLL